MAEWEEGHARPTIGQLRRLAELYRRPLAVLFLSEPPQDFDAIRDFRRLHGVQEEELSDNLQDELRRAQELRDAALALVDDEDRLPTFPLSAALGDDPEATGERVRTVLAVPAATQLERGDSYQALREWKAAVEALGVLVIQMSSVSLEEARGFSVARLPLPVIALNSQDTANGRTFTLVHELTHLALHEGGICEWSRERRLEAAAKRIEAFCNHVAGAALIPGDLLAAILKRSTLPNPDAWPDEAIRHLARTFKVSEEALLRRLVVLGYATNDLYAAKREEFQRRYEEARLAASTPIVSYEKRVVGALGPAYVELAFTAYYRKRLSLSELSDFLGVRVTNLGKVEREVFGLSRIPGAEP